MTKPDISGIAPFFIVKNVPAALAFYRDRLGFEITFQGPEPDDIFFGIVKRGAAMIISRTSVSIHCRTTSETSREAGRAGTPTARPRSGRIGRGILVAQRRVLSTAQGRRRRFARIRSPGRRRIRAVFRPSSFVSADSSRSVTDSHCAEEDVLAVILRMLAPVTVILFTCSAGAALQEQRGTAPSMDLARFVNGERLAQQLPGLAAVVVRSDGPPRVYVSGERRIGKGDLITPADRMHLGSLTKAITATLIGALAEKQLMTLETTIGQTFPELSARIQPAYRDVSVRQLSHAARAYAGIVAMAGLRAHLARRVYGRHAAPGPDLESGGDRRDGRADRRFPYRQLVQLFRSAWRPRGVWQSWTRGRASTVGTHSNDSWHAGGHTGEHGVYDASRDRAGRRCVAIDAGLRALSATPLAWPEGPR